MPSWGPELDEVDGIKSPEDMGPPPLWPLLLWLPLLALQALTTMFMGRGAQATIVV